MAARRAGIKKVIIPKANLKDLEEMPKELKEDVRFIAVEEIGQVFDEVFVKKIERKSVRAKKRVEDKSVIMPKNARSGDSVRC